MTWNLELPCFFALCIVLSNVFSGIDTKNRSKLSNFAIEPLLRLQRYYYIFGYEKFVIGEIKSLRVLLFSL